MKSIFIYGASGHGLVVGDIAKACGFDDIRFIDDGDENWPSFDDIKECNTIPIALAIGNNKVRKQLFNKLKKFKFNILSLIHPSAIISSDSIILEGTVVMPNVVVNAKSKVGKGTILNTSCIVEHENIIGSFVHISPNSSLAGNVKIDEFSHIGIGSSIIQGITIGKNTIIGAGSVVTKNIHKNKLCYGNPCLEIKDLDE